MSAFVLFATGSSLSVEYASTCRRLGLAIAAGVANREGPSHLPGDVRIVGLRDIDDMLLATPCLCPLFTPANRRIAVDEAMQLGFRFPASLIDPTAILADDFATGGGCFVNAGVVVGASTVLGEQVVINRGASVGHHVTLGDFASLGPSVVLAGHVTVGAGAVIGAGAVVLPEISIGENAVVGAGAIVTRPVPAGGKVLGQAARLVEPAQGGTPGPSGGSTT